MKILMKLENVYNKAVAFLFVIYKDLKHSILNVIAPVDIDEILEEGRRKGLSRTTIKTVEMQTRRRPRRAQVEAAKHFVDHYLKRQVFKDRFFSRPDIIEKHHFNETP